MAADPESPAFGRLLLLQAVVVVGVLLLVEGALGGYFGFRDAWKLSESMRAEGRHSRHDSDLGWSNLPDRVFPNMYGPGAHLSTNAQGFRATEDYTREAPPGRQRVVFAGDSFTMGFGVGDAETYPAQIEALDPGIQSVNMGMGAYGLDQVYLWYLRDGTPLETDVLVVAFSAEDLRRMTTDHFISPKPQLVLRDGELVTRNVPVPYSSASRRLARFWEQLRGDLGILRALDALLGRGEKKDGKEDIQAALRAATEDREVRALAEQVFLELKELSDARGQGLLLVYLPTQYEPSQAESPARWLEVFAEKQGIASFDATAAFDPPPSAKDPRFRKRDGHYSVEGNALVARALRDQIRARWPEPSRPTRPARGPREAPADLHAER